MAVNGVGSGGEVKFVDPDKVGFAGLTSETFMELLITQLQNQDPLEPVGNDELLSQISAMRNLQSNIEMSDALKAVTVNQRLSTAATFIGKTVTGTDADNERVTGVVDRAFVRDGQAFVGIGDVEVALDGIESVNK